MQTGPKAHLFLEMTSMLPCPKGQVGTGRATPVVCNLYNLLPPTYQLNYARERPPRVE
jgi:hypothetical protein